MVLFKGFLQFFFNFYYVGTCAVSITQACFFVRPRSFFSTSFLGTITWCPQPMHFRRKSAPTRMISHSLQPHGCGFFSFTISPTAYLSILYSFSTYICHIIYYDMRVKRYFAPHTTPLSAQIQSPVPAVSEGLLLRPSVWWTC